LWLLDPTCEELGNHIIVGVKDDKPYILKPVPYLKGNGIRGDGFCFYGLYDSKMHRTADYAGDFIRPLGDLGSYNEMYVLDDIDDLVDFLKTFCNKSYNKTNVFYEKVRM
jgi:hypothetical protein